MINPSFAAKNHIAWLPREIQDQIFDGLGNELIPFVESRSTILSALPALFKHFCRALPSADPQLLSEDAYQLFVLNRIKKEIKIRDALSKRPSWAHLVNELTLAIPNARLSTNDNSDTIEHLPRDWNGSAISALLQQLPKLRKLNLKAIWVKRCASPVHCSIVPYATPTDSQTLVAIPSTIHELSMEDIVIEDESDSTIDMLATEEMDLWAHEQTVLLRMVTGLEHITKLTIVTPMLFDMYGHVLDAIPRLTNMVEFVLHHGNTWGGLDTFIIEAILQALGHCHELRVFEFLYPSPNDRDPFPRDWPNLVPQLRVFRTPLRRFADAFSMTQPHHDIHFKVLVDPREIDETEAGVVFGNRGNPFQARRLVQAVKEVDAFLSVARRTCAQRQRAKQDGDAWLPHADVVVVEEEKRNVEFVECRVDETMSWYWFSRNDQERNCFLRALNKTMYGQ